MLLRKLKRYYNDDNMTSKRPWITNNNILEEPWVSSFLLGFEKTIHSNLTHSKVPKLKSCCLLWISDFQPGVRKRFAGVCKMINFNENFWYVVSQLSKGWESLLWIKQRCPRVKIMVERRGILGVLRAFSSNFLTKNIKRVQSFFEFFLEWGVLFKIPAPFSPPLSPCVVRSSSRSTFVTS